MKIIKSVKSMLEERMQMINKTVGFVPTMGFFHDGHLSLMQQARDENDVLIVSVFVNPLQFGENEDFNTYPRDEDRDIRLAKEQGVDVLFIPKIADMYPTELSVTMVVGQRANVLCGRSRPGHFNGVVTVLTKLFNLIQPHQVYVGMKDAQQVAVIDGLITDYNFPIRLIGLPTIREENGLAKSSRNVYLASQEQDEAVWIQKALKLGQELVTEDEKSAADIIKIVKQTISVETQGRIDYVELLSYPTLGVIDRIEETVILAIAVNFKNVRLIDSIIFNHNGTIIERLS